MIDQLPKEIIDSLPSAQRAEYAVYHNARHNTMVAYNADSTAANMKNWEGARAGLSEFSQRIMAQLNNGDQVADHPTTFATQQEVLAYLKSSGYKIEKSALSNHVRTRHLIKKANGFRRRDIDHYAELHLRNAATGQDAADKKTTDLLERKLRAECLRTEEQAAKAKIERETLEGKLIPREEVELELAGRAVALEAGYEHMVYTRAAEWIEVVAGEQSRADRLITALLNAKNEWLNQYASATDFVVVLKKDA